MTSTRIKSEPFTLTSGDTALIPSGNRADGVAAVYSTVWKFTVPPGQVYSLGPDDLISLYLEDTGTDEAHDHITQVRLRMTDVANADEKLVMNAVPYVQVQEFADRRKVAHIQSNQVFTLKEEMSLMIEVKSETGKTIKESTSAFRITMHRVYEGI